VLEIEFQPKDFLPKRIEKIYEGRLKFDPDSLPCYQSDTEPSFVFGLTKLWLTLDVRFGGFWSWWQVTIAQRKIDFGRLIRDVIKLFIIFFVCVWIIALLYLHVKFQLEPSTVKSNLNFAFEASSVRPGPYLDRISLIEFLDLLWLGFVALFGILIWNLNGTLFYIHVCHLRPCEPLPIIPLELTRSRRDYFVVIRSQSFESSRRLCELISITRKKRPNGDEQTPNNVKSLDFVYPERDTSLTQVEQRNTKDLWMIVRSIFMRLGTISPALSHEPSTTPSFSTSRYAKQFYVTLRLHQSELQALFTLVCFALFGHAFGLTSEEPTAHYVITLGAAGVIWSFLSVVAHREKELHLEQWEEACIGSESFDGVVFILQPDLVGRQVWIEMDYKEERERVIQHLGLSKPELLQLLLTGMTIIFLAFLALLT
jgi:hypothetical protein